MLGNIDLLVCGNSDPGTSGILSPFGKIDGLYFNNSREPDDYEYSFKKDIENILSQKGVNYIQITADNKEDYYKILDELTEFNKNSIVVEGTSKNQLTLIVEDLRDQDVEDIKDGKDEDEEPSIDDE